MVKKTPNHALNLYQTGDKDWTHTPDMKTLEERLWVHDIARNRDEYIAYEDAAFLATDTGDVYLGNGSDWSRLGKIDGESNDEADRGDKMGEVFVREFDGNDLSEKINTAINYLNNKYSGHGRIRVTPRNDGEPWQWENNVIIDWNNDNNKGVHIDIDRNCVIEYTGDGTCLTINDGATRLTEPHHISGGVWKTTGNNPDGWLALVDVVGALVENVIIENWENNNGDCLGIRIDNWNAWSELNTIRKIRFAGDRGINFRPHDETEGPGDSSSFQGTTITDIHIEANDYGIRLGGSFMVSDIRRPNIFLTDDGAAAMVFASDDMRGCTISAFQVENLSGYDNTAAIELTDDYEGWMGTPIILSRWFEGVDNDVRTENGGSYHGRIFELNFASSELRIQNLENEDGISIDRHGNVTSTGPITVEADNRSLTLDADGNAEIKVDGESFIRMWGDRIQFRPDGDLKAQFRAGDLRLDDADVNFDESQKIKNHLEGETDSNPTTDAPDGFLEIEDTEGQTKYVPFYD